MMSEFKPKAWMACPMCGKQSPMPDPDDRLYESGWNAALEMAAIKLGNNFKHAFGADTCASWAAWLKEQKR
jgi:hypothetical protein